MDGGGNSKEGQNRELSRDTRFCGRLKEFHVGPGIGYHPRSRVSPAYLPPKRNHRSASSSPFEWTLSARPELRSCPVRKRGRLDPSHREAVRGALPRSDSDLEVVQFRVHVETETVGRGQRPCDIELSSAAGGEPLVVELSWSEGIRPSTPRSHRGDTAPLVTLFALFCHTAQQAGSPPGLTAPVDSETGRVLRRVQQLLLDATPTRGRNKWIRQLFGPHPLHLLGESGWEGHNALSALVEISGKSVLVATLNTEYLQPEDIRFHTGKAQLSRSEIGTWLTSVGLPVPSVDRRSRSDAVDALVRLATGLKQSGQWHEALETFHRAAELARLEHRHSEESVCLRSIGEIALTRVPPAEARRWLERAIETARLSGDRDSGVGAGAPGHVPSRRGG